MTTISSQSVYAPVNYRNAYIAGSACILFLAISGVALGILFNRTFSDAFQATSNLHQTMSGKIFAYGTLGAGSLLAVATIALAIAARRIKPPTTRSTSKARRPPSTYELSLKNDFRQKFTKLSSDPETPQVIKDVLKKFNDNLVEMIGECRNEKFLLVDLFSHAHSILDEYEEISRALQSSQETQEPNLSIEKALKRFDLFAIIRSGDYQQIVSVINADNVNAELDLMKETVIHYLAKKELHTQLIERFANLGADFNKQDSWGNTPLMWAIANGQNTIAMEILRCGMPRGMNLGIVDHMHHKNTALHLAVGKGYTNVTFDGNPLVVSNAKLVASMVENLDPKIINIPNMDGNTPLHLAYLRKDKQMIDILENALGSYWEIPLNKNGETPKDMLKKNFVQASEILNQTVAVFLLERNLFTS